MRDLTSGVTATIAARFGQDAAEPAPAAQATPAATAAPERLPQPALPRSPDERATMTDTPPASTRPPAPQVPRSIRLVAHAAALTLVPSGLWRIAVALGWDSGFTDEVLGPENFPGEGSPYLIGLSLFAEVLGLLTLGLIHRWGEELPGWVPFLGGRRIPVPVAVIPASLGAALVTLITVTGALSWNDADNMGAAGSPEGGHYWLMTACYLPLLAWGPLLAVVTVAYYRRRRAY